MHYILQTNASGSTELQKVRDNGTTRLVGEDDPSYLEWVAAGNPTEIIPYVPPVGPTLEELKAAKSAAVQAEKVRVRDAGFLVEGILFDSDGAAQLAYTQQAIRLMQNPDFSTPWKASLGVWVTMNAAQFALVSVACETHINQIFGWQALKDQAIAVATLETIDAISTVFGE